MITYTSKKTSFVIIGLLYDWFTSIRMAVSKFGNNHLTNIMMWWYIHAWHCTITINSHCRAEHRTVLLLITVAWYIKINKILRRCAKISWWQGGDPIFCCDIDIRRIWITLFIWQHAAVSAGGINYLPGQGSICTAIFDMLMIKPKNSSTIQNFIQFS